MSEKKLSHAHLLEGAKLADLVEKGDVSAMGKLLAIYLADSDILWKMKANPEILEPLEKQALAMDYDAAADLLVFFMAALRSYSRKLNASATLGIGKK